MLKLHRPKLVNDLHKKLHFELDSAGLKANHLPSSCPNELKELELPILQEAIDLRQNGDTKFSLRLLEIAGKGGLSSPWIDDNRARALVNLQRYSEAVSIWRNLKNSNNSAAKKAAIEMLEVNEEKGKEEDILKEVETLTSKTNNPEDGQKKAIQILINAIMDNPKSKTLQNRLGAIAAERSNDKNKMSPHFPELDVHTKAIAGFNALLSELERRATDNAPPLIENK